MAKKLILHLKLIKYALLYSKLSQVVIIIILIISDDSDYRKKYWVFWAFRHWFLPCHQKYCAHCRVRFSFQAFLIRAPHEIEFSPYGINRVTRGGGGCVCGGGGGGGGGVRFLQDEGCGGWGVGDGAMTAQ